MGFSVSGATALLFVAALVSFGMLYTATANGGELINDAEDGQRERLLEQRNTELEIATVSYDGGNDTLTVTVNNTGSTSLSVSDTDLLVDNSYTSANTSVEGSTTTDLWLPGETLTLSASVASRPTQVKVVSGPGVAATEVL